MIRGRGLGGRAARAVQDRPPVRRLLRRVGRWASVRAARPADRAQCLRLLGRAAEPDAGARRLYVAAVGPLVLGAVPVNDVGRDPIDGWFVGLLRVRTAARGMGLGERLLRRAEADARAGGAPSLWGIVTVGNTPMERLAAKVGLAPFTTPALRERLGRLEREFGVRRTYLRKDLM
ncbi:MAG TPA: GNAT family N-acetyltransferase [Thermoleophilia bacterium]|nr:GNAT family N-acetyltransferase [Thermoleophilia bacterium]